MRPLHDSYFALCRRRLKAPTFGKIVLNRSFMSINSLIPCDFSLPENKIPARAKIYLYLFYCRSTQEVGYWSFSV
ncbi:MAG: hypothetical protein ACJAU3_000881 [Zhongshania sp.]|jgi:hypothetical protein